LALSAVFFKPILLTYSGGSNFNANGLSSPQPIDVKRLLKKLDLDGK
jgi:hypothetical protein